MITVSLDEKGNFEKEVNEPMFIGGLIFDDCGDRLETQIERGRIAAYYRKIMEDLNTSGEHHFSYPESLHSNGNATRDKEEVKPVKQKVSETLSEFIKEGTYGNQALLREKRNGKYHLFVILKSDDGMRKLLSDNASMLAKDDYAANRYVHMASTVVNRIIFHNPIYANMEMPAVNIDIATRSTGAVSQLDTQTQNEFKKQAYKLGQYQNYSIMNADIYRTIIAQEMLNSGKINIKIENLYVRSIRYDVDASKMEFLYLSDSICSFLGHKLKNSGAEKWLEKIKNKIHTLNPNEENLIFGYDEIDNYFAEAWKCYENHDPYKALSITYDAKNKKGQFAEHYRNTWFPYLEDRVRSTISPELFSKAVNDLYHILTTSNLDQEKLLYLMQQFERMIPRVSEKYKSPEKRAEDLYKLYEAGVSAFCHIGNAKQALSYFEKCKEYAFYAGVDAYLRINNKLAVCLEDSFEWDKAAEIAEETVSNQELASEMKRSILKNGNESDYLDEARSISQWARILAEKRSPEAEDKFRKALSKLKHGSANYKITQSYLLHFYADMGMQDKFESEATDYFDGNDTYGKRLRYLIRLGEETHSAFSKEYALYVLFRGLFNNGLESINDNMWTKICNIKEFLTKKDGKEPGGHPWEIIYKYLELIAIYRGDKDAQKKFIAQRKECLRYRGEMISSLEKFGEAEVYNYMGEFDERDQITLELVKYMKDNFPIVADKSFSEDGNVRYQELEQYFTFMYR